MARGRLLWRCCSQVEECIGIDDALQVGLRVPLFHRQIVILWIELCLIILTVFDILETIVATITVN